SIGADRQVPLTGGQIVFGVEGTAPFGQVTGIKVWHSKNPKWSYASAATFPFAGVGVDVGLQVGNAIRTTHDHVTGIYDMAFVPMLVGYHKSQLEHMSFNLTIFAPTGSYEKGRLANIGLNVWTFTPGFAYTKIWAAQNFELTSSTAVDFSTENNDTNYKNAPMFRTDLLGIKRYKNGWGFGGIFGWMQQLGDDTGPLPDRLGGFVGHMLGAGPIVVYSTKINQKTTFSMDVRFIPEFANKNLLKGNPVMINTSFVF